MIGVGVIGLGFMGATHVRAYQAAERSGIACRVVAVSDRSADRLSGRSGSTGNLATGSGAMLFDPSRVRTYLDAHQLLRDPAVNLVSICTHTDTHVDLAIAALRAGKHVLVEKPVAITSAEVQRLAEAARTSDRLCMPAMCMRFWPGWAYLRETIRSGSLGQVMSATFQRLGSPPDWADFYKNVNLSGGPLWDLHIHDSDFVRWCFGEPTEVVSTGTLAHTTTIYRYPGAGPTHVVAEGSQDYCPGFGFKMRYVVSFEKGTLDFDIGRPPHSSPLLLCADGQTSPVDLTSAPATGYDGEIRHLLGAILAGSTSANLVATIDDAVKTARLIEAERRSLESRRPVPLA